MIRLDAERRSRDMEVMSRYEVFAFDIISDPETTLEVGGINENLIVENLRISE